MVPKGEQFQFLPVSTYSKTDAKNFVTIQLTFDLPDSGVKSAQIPQIKRAFFKPLGNQELA